MTALRQIVPRLQSVVTSTLTTQGLLHCKGLHRMRMTIVQPTAARSKPAYGGGLFGDRALPCLRLISAGQAPKPAPLRRGWTLRPSAMSSSGDRSASFPLSSSSVSRSFGAPCRGDATSTSKHLSRRCVASRAGDQSSAATSGGGGGKGGGGNGSGGGRGDHNGKPRSESLWDAYVRLLEEAPIATKSLSTIVLNGLGDMMAQILIEKRYSSGDWDLRRFGIQCFLGGVLIGPALHFWYTVLNNVFPSRSVAGTVKRVIADQFGFAPFFLPTFLFCLYFLEGRRETIVQDISSQWLDVVVSNWKLWIPFQIINFGLIPPNLQVMAANVCAVGWNTYLSFISHKEPSITE